MSRSVQISDETAKAINELGGTFDSPDDVIQQLVKKAGHEELLEQGTEEGSTTAQSKTANSAKERKEQFLSQLESRDEVEGIEKLRRSSWKVETDAGTKIIWIHYHVDFQFWGGSWNVNDELSDPGELIHVFLGPGVDQLYIVPDDELHSGQFTIYNTEDESQWKISTDRGTPPNGEILEDSYTDLAPIFG